MDATDCLEDGWILSMTKDPWKKTSNLKICEINNITLMSSVSDREHY